MKHQTHHKKPLIGITTSSNPNYLALLSLKWAVFLAGGHSIHLSPQKNIHRFRDINGLIISGGADIDPRLYHDSNRHSVDIEPDRDQFEVQCASMALSSKLPILGICRGAQMINIAAGGTLYQDATEAYPDFIPTSSQIAKIFYRRKIAVSMKSHLYGKLDDKTLWVNSLHHQAVKKVGHNLKAIAKDEHGIIQALEGQRSDQFLLGLQWHPEYMLYSRQQRKIFHALISAARSTMPLKKQQTQPQKQNFNRAEAAE